MVEKSQITNNHVTYTKAIAIILMVLVHASTPSFLGKLVSMFHMPLFFFMSGYCFKEKYLLNPMSFVIKRVKGLYFPFVKWGCFFLILHNVFLLTGIYSTESGYNDCIYGFSDLLQRGWGVLKFKYSEQLLGGYWFLSALFFASLISFFCIKFIRNLYLAILFTIGGGFILGFLFKNQLHTFGLCEKWFLASSMFIVGYIFAHNKILPFNIKLTLIGFSLVIIGTFFWPMSMHLDYYSSPMVFPYFFTAIIGTWCVYSCCFLLLNEPESKLERLLCFIGENTISILTWHFLSFKLVSLLIVKVYNYRLDLIGQHPVISEKLNIFWSILYTVVGVFLPLLFVLFKKKFLCKTNN